MKDHLESNDEPLRSLLRSARSAPPLPPRFQESVWRRLESPAALARKTPSPLAWLEGWVERLLLPRVALASLTLLLAAGGVAGVVSSAGVAKQQAQARYLSAVAPNPLR
ncbi:MAG: hypothetical protein NTW03_13520 [Verrucomicrobia bacterium]|nr:hypothetical protein [Verrucomicrobiota bacterium]